MVERMDRNTLEYENYLAFPLDGATLVHEARDMIEEMQEDRMEGESWH
jgi:hypothetical protein